MYDIFYLMMIVGFAGVSAGAPDVKGKIIGFLLLIVNALIFYKG